MKEQALLIGINRYQAPGAQQAAGRGEECGGAE